MELRPCCWLISLKASRTVLAGVGGGGARLHALAVYVVGEEAGGGTGSPGGGPGPRKGNRQTGWWEKPSWLLHA